MTGQYTTLSEAIRSRIDEAYGGNQAAFARSTGLGPGYVNHLLKGKVAVPSPENREVIARELGMRRLDLLVLTGAIIPDEAVEIAVPEERLTPEERRLLAAFRQSSPGSRRSLLLIADELAMVSEQVAVRT